MKRVIIAACLVCVASVAGAQASRGSFYDDQSILHFTLVADFGQFKHDARDLKSPYRSAHIKYLNGGTEISVPVRIKPRGIWRRKSCDMPPVRLSFDKDSTHKTLFTKQHRMKLVVSCRNNDENEQYLLSEFQLYRVYNLLTPFSFKARLAHVAFVDSKKGDTIQNRYAFLGEEPEDAATRLGGKPVPLKNAQGDDLDEMSRAMFGIFQYFIGNTDFSVTQLHNVLLVRRDSLFDVAFPIARDFDWSGAVNARYAFPDYRLPIKNVRERLMKGDCAPKAVYDSVFQIFRAKKAGIYGLYRDSLAAGMKPDVVKKTLEYFDDFYETINNPRATKDHIISDCGPS